VLLVKGADFLVDGASSLAKRLRVSTLVIGLTIVAFGTSMPELIVNILAAVKGTGDVAFGNIIGSNLANILLILGVSALVADLKVHRSTTWKEIPFSLLAAFVLLVFAGVPILDKLSLQNLVRSQGIILVLFFLIFLYYAFELARQKKNEIQTESIVVPQRSPLSIVLFIIAGLAALYLGGQWVVDGAVAIARALRLSEFLISVTIIAVGTSLPELVTSVKAARKNDTDLAVGNVVGSNIFNIFWILGVTAIIRPIAFPPSAIVDILVLAAATILLFASVFFGKKHTIGRAEGICFLVAYAAYLVFVIFRG